MNNISKIIPIIFIILNTTLSVSFLTSLDEVCPSYSEMIRTYNQQHKLYKQKSEELNDPQKASDMKYTIIDLENKNALLNIQAISKGLIGDYEKIGEGSFGKVYKIETLNLKSREIKYEDRIVKIIRVNNDAETDEGEDQQDMLEIEVKANIELNQLDPNGFFFPELSGCYGITPYVDIITPEDGLNETQEDNIMKNDNQDLFALISEPLDIELFTYYISILDIPNIYIPEPNQRLNLFNMAVQGLLVMHQKYFHCDIKPENMMLKKINAETISKMMEQEIEPARLMPNEYYQLKYIDFGLVAGGEFDQRECMGGTDGFKGDEYLSKNTSNENFDVYSLGMTFLNMELAIQNYSFFSSIDSKIYKLKKNKKKISNTEVEYFEKSSLVKRMKALMEDPKYKSTFLKVLKNYSPLFTTAMQKLYSDQDYTTISTHDYLYANGNLFRDMMICAIKVYFETYIAKGKVPQQVHKLLDKINVIKNKLSEKGLNDQNLITNLTVKQNYYTAKVQMVQIQSKLRTNLINLYLSMIKTDYRFRPNLGQINEMLKLYYTEFKTYLDQYEEVEMYEDEIPEEGVVKMDLRNIEEIIDVHRLKKSNLMKTVKILQRNVQHARQKRLFNIEEMKQQPHLMNFLLI